MWISGCLEADCTVDLLVSVSSFRFCLLSFLMLPPFSTTNVTSLKLKSLQLFSATQEHTLEDFLAGWGQSKIEEFEFPLNLREYNMHL